jgi:hypothetical protein
MALVAVLAAMLSVVVVLDRVILETDVFELGLVLAPA